jgi:hypothetical protein
MIPSNPRGRRLIVVYGHSALEVFALDRCFVETKIVLRLTCRH